MNPSFEDILGKWLIKMSLFYKENSWGVEGYDSECWNLLCQILKYADNQGFLLEAYNWMNSPKGWTFFERDSEFGLAANMVLIKTHELGEIEDSVEEIDGNYDDNQLIEAIRNFYNSMLTEVAYSI